MKSKFPPINPQYVKNKNGKVTKVYLPFEVYESIFDEIDELKSKLKKVKSKKSKGK